MSATTTHLLSSGEVCRLRYDTIPVKSASGNVFSIPITQKCQMSDMLSCDLESSDSGQQPVVGSAEHENELLISKGRG